MVRRGLVAGDNDTRVRDLTLKELKELERVANRAYAWNRGAPVPPDQARADLNSLLWIIGGHYWVDAVCNAEAEPKQ